MDFLEDPLKVISLQIHKQLVRRELQLKTAQDAFMEIAAGLPEPEARAQKAIYDINKIEAVDAEPPKTS
jgi:hypothetical protein